MSDVIEFRTRGGGVVAVQVAEANRPADEPTTRGMQQAVEEAGRLASIGFEEALDQIRPATEAIVSLVDRLTTSPDQISVEFGIGFHGELGALITKAGADANLQVTMTWRSAPHGD